MLLDCPNIGQTLMILVTMRRTEKHFCDVPHSYSVVAAHQSGGPQGDFLCSSSFQRRLESSPPFVQTIGATGSQRALGRRNLEDSRNWPAALSGRHALSRHQCRWHSRRLNCSLLPTGPWPAYAGRDARLRVPSPSRHPRTVIRQHNLAAKINHVELADGNVVERLRDDVHARV